MHRPSRRRLLLAVMAGCCGAGGLAAATAAQNRSAKAEPGQLLQFPRDHGSHPAFRIEWWYITGWVQDQAARELGFQITFFRARPQLPAGNPRAVNPEPLLLAHAAIGAPGALNANAFVTGTAAGDADDRIIYNSSTGQLFYDADGNGAGSAVLFAQLNGTPTLSASDFQVI